MPSIRETLLKAQARRLPPTSPAQPAKARDLPRIVVRDSSTFGVERRALVNPTYQNKVTLHVSPADSHRAIIEAIKGAKEAFWIEIFIWHNDESGREVAQALIDAKKANPKLDVKVLIDWAGLRDQTNMTDDRKIVAFLRENGIDVREFNVGGVDPTALGGTPITHRKLFIQDGRLFLSGGRNIGDEYLKPTFFNPRRQAEKAWHDLMYTIEGDETGRVQREFLKNWVRAGGEIPAHIPASRGAIGGTAWVQSIVTDPHSKKKELREAHLKVIRSAQREIRITYPYFSDDAMIEALIEAKKANPKLDVKVLLPGRTERGLPGFLYSNLNVETSRQLLEAGINVRFLHTAPAGTERVETFSHFKAMVVDGKLLSIGSANGDARTLSQNHELNNLIVDEEVAAQFINEVMEPDWRDARPITLAEIAKLPFWKKWLHRVLELVDFIF